MDDNRRYEAFVRNRITELREQKGVSEHRMSLELGKSGSYIRSITNGISMPSLRELFNIMEYFDLTPTLFFAPSVQMFCVSAAHIEASFPLPLAAFCSFLQIPQRLLRFSPWSILPEALFCTLSTASLHQERNI